MAGWTDERRAGSESGIREGMGEWKERGASEGTSQRIRGRNDIVVDTKKDGSGRKEAKSGPGRGPEPDGRPNKTPIEDVEEDEIKGLPLPSHFRCRRPLGRTERRASGRREGGRHAQTRREGACPEEEEARKEREERKSHFRRTNEGTDERTSDGIRENKGRVRSAREERAPISQIGFGSRRD